jgi:RNA polymerase sigma-70 factor (ECF subfamily)
MVENERRVLTLAWRLLGGMDDAQDAVQEVFLRAFKYLHRFDVNKPFVPWLMRITVNVCRDLGRKRGSLPDSLAAVDAPHAEPVAEGRAGNPHAELASVERREMLWAALEQLPRKERAAIVLRDLEGLSTREVAGLLKSSPATVRSQISSARLKIGKSIRRMKGTEL